MTTDKTKNFFRVSAEDFKKIPGSPIAYNVSDHVRSIFESAPAMENIGKAIQGMITGDNDSLLRFWSEVSFEKISLNSDNDKNSHWVPYNKGGAYRRWFGNHELIVDWSQKGQNFTRNRSVNSHLYFREYVAWTYLSSTQTCARYFPQGFLWDVHGSGIFPNKKGQILLALSFINSIVGNYFLTVINPTLSFQVENLVALPFLNSLCCIDSTTAQNAVNLTKQDWDAYETSWNFQSNPLCVSPQERADQLSYGIHSEERKKAVSLISERYLRLRQEWKQQTEEMRKLEIENNRIFIEAYGLQDELTPEVPWNEITLTCNPWYRYGKKPEDMDLLGNSLYMNISEGKVMPTSKQEEDCPAGDFPFAAETEQRLLEDTIKEFISYAVGCMMGRYSPEKPGLILANQGSTVDDYFNIMGDKEKHIANGDLFEQTTTSLIDIPYSENSFCGTRYHQIIDADGVLPILDEEWFVDDIVTQFKNFVAFIFGKENLTANMDFIEAVLGKDIRKYFVKDFYKEHIQRYKKRPIYWLFSSPKGSFNALIYLHRYTPDTVSIVLNEYLRELMTKISTRIKHLIEENNRTDISNADKTRNLKQIDKYTAQLAELEDYERDVIFPLAQQKIAIDLDDGVKVNYCKFGAALKKIPGLEANEE